MIYILLAAGPVENIPPLFSLKEKFPNATWIGVDRGVYHLLSHHINPKIAIGDFDSLSKEEKKKLEKENLSFFLYPTEKDKTDLELAIDWTISQRAKEIIILGATGGRLDHFLMNVQLLQKGLEKNINITIVDKGNRITLKNPGEYTIEKNEYKYVSFLPMSSRVTGITLKGFRYPLQNKELVQGSSLCISNELVENIGTYSFSTGQLLVMECNDLPK